MTECYLNSVFTEHKGDGSPERYQWEMATLTQPVLIRVKTEERDRYPHRYVKLLNLDTGL